MKRTGLCILAVLLVATFSVPAAADQLPGIYSTDVISNFANATCGQAFVNQPTFVGGVQTRPGNITIFVDFANSLPTPVVNPALATGNCTTNSGQVAGATFDVCYVGLPLSLGFVTTISDTNKNGRIDGGEGFISAEFIPHGTALGAFWLEAPGNGTCGDGSIEFASGYHRR
jgi:hypothetical protein